MSSPSDDHRARLTKTFMGRAPWPRELDPLLESQPQLLESYLRLSKVPWVTGELDPVLRHLVYAAIDAVPLSVYPPGLKMHARQALDLGAEAPDVHLAVAIGGLVALETVVDALSRLGQTPCYRCPSGELCVHADLRSSFASIRGAWDPRLEPLLVHVPLAEAWWDVIGDVWSSPSRLTPAERELILVAALCAHSTPAASLDFPMSRALAGGLTTANVAEAISLVAPLGMHATTEALRHVSSDTSMEPR